MSNSTMLSLPPYPQREGSKSGRLPAHLAKQRVFFKSKLGDAINEIYARGDAWSARGWCYSLEPFGLFKGDFDSAEELIKELRLDGTVPLDAILEDKMREWHGFESTHNKDTADYAKTIISYIRYYLENYRPFSFWDRQDSFVCMAVEKIDLVSIFKPICNQYQVPIANFRGSPDFLGRGKVLLEFMRHWEQGRSVVVLYCGDHDPAGLRMSGQEMQDNFAKMHHARIGNKKLFFRDDLFRIERFGLNKDFIDKNNIQWIENLHTGQKDKSKCNDLADPKHTDHYKPYVQDYLKEFCSYKYDDKLKCDRWFGRKVEANALVSNKKLGQDLCREAIERYISRDSVQRFNTDLIQPRLELSAVLSKKLMEGVALDPA